MISIKLRVVDLLSCFTCDREKNLDVFQIWDIQEKELFQEIKLCPECQKKPTHKLKKNITDKSCEMKKVVRSFISDQKYQDYLHNRDNHDLLEGLSKTCNFDFTIKCT